MTAFIYSEAIGRAGGWIKQAHPRMRKFDQYYHEGKNAYLSVMKDGAWELFLPVEVAGIECFPSAPTHRGTTEQELTPYL
ncbi:hypothetical protein [Bradyrhizobium sp. 2S1]|uniref:hypothetical protein n=1 Tax=Bradyrhizobium sp. 2S1 TaxID=1404429 RepID=UPI001408C392|nr:hypothetical protein [Bradyrhizobium sp. 2S1]MCK7669153.1 hypothetical protein [Bradyrhizobium sp. 2S1]